MKTLAEYLSEKGVDPLKTIVEAGGEVYPPGTDLSQIPYDPSVEVSFFRIVAGG